MHRDRNHGVTLPHSTTLEHSTLSVHEMPRGLKGPRHVQELAIWHRVRPKGPCGNRVLIMRQGVGRPTDRLSAPLPSLADAELQTWGGVAIKYVGKILGFLDPFPHCTNSDLYIIINTSSITSSLPFQVYILYGCPLAERAEQAEQQRVSHFLRLRLRPGFSRSDGNTADII